MSSSSSSSLTHRQCRGAAGRCMCMGTVQHSGLHAPESSTVGTMLAPLLCPPPVGARVQNVQDQLLLWQAETQRVTREPATYYSKFEDHELFSATLATAQGHGSVLWYRQDTNPEASFILIRRSGG